MLTGTSQTRPRVLLNAHYPTKLPTNDNVGPLHAAIPDMMCSFKKLASGCP
jgi:hypothetical protein